MVEQLAAWPLEGGSVLPVVCLYQQRGLVEQKGEGAAGCRMICCLLLECVDEPPSGLDRPAIPLQQMSGAHFAAALGQGLTVVPAFSVKSPALHC